MSGDLTMLAAQLRNAGAAWSEVLGTLQARGASRLDLVRAVRDVDGVTLGEATKVVNESGVVPSAEFEIIIDDDDPFYRELFSDEYEGKPDDGQ